MTTSILALDIQHEQIISVLLSHGLKGIQVVESISVPMLDVLADENAFFSGLENVLPEISGRMGTSHDRCVVSIPATSFLFRTLEMPFKHHRKIEQIIPHELENYLPFQTGTFDFDFYVLHKSDKTLSGNHLVSVASVAQAKLDRYKTLLIENGLNPDGITVGSGYSTALVFAGMADQAAVSILIYVESLFAGIYIIRSGQIAFCRSFVLDPDDPVSAVEKNLTHTCLSFTERFKNKFPVNSIAISGTAGFLEQLGNKIETRMQVSVRLVNVFEVLKISLPTQDFGSRENDKIQNAAAMAVNEIKGVDGYNFCRQVSGVAQFFQEHRFSMVSSIALLVFLLLTWSIQPIVSIDLMEKRSRDFDKRITQVFQSCFPDIKNIVDPVQQMQVQVAALRKERNVEYAGKHLLNIDVLNQISMQLPPEMDVVMTRFVRMENNLLLAGSADQFNTIDRMKSHFENVDIFKDVDINSAAMDKIVNRVNFSLKILL